MAGKQHASDFEKIIHEARDRKKNEALAARIFGTDRRSSAPHQKPKPALGGSLAARVGVKKRVASTAGPRQPIPTGPRPKQQPKQQQQHTSNINGEWTHDLHEQQQSRSSTPRQSAAGAGSLASRITNPNAPPAGPASRVRNNPRRAAQVSRALTTSELSPASRGGSGHHLSAATVRQQPLSQTNGSAWGNNNNKGITIRGLAGPFVVMAQNFAPGTTAADIESAVTPVGGLVQSCRLLKTEPIVIAEIVFESKEGADRVIETFNNQTADGRLIHVYYKVGGGSASTPASSSSKSAPSHAPREPRAIRPAVVDGSMGFDDPMETTDSSSRAAVFYEDVGRGNDTRKRTGNGGLYSDNLVPQHQHQQQSNGQQRRGGGGGGGGYGRGRDGGRR
ncbi:hypothetical protein GE09DRAFT_1117316 [Coniochaeta sp. 2T2.1]|nr:hypothetical protein GE09DRAFT_1117316 [Coniochaeta sp. 2T2.1]